MKALAIASVFGLVAWGAAQNPAPSPSQSNDAYHAALRRAQMRADRIKAENDAARDAHNRAAVELEKERRRQAATDAETRRTGTGAIHNPDGSVTIYDGGRRPPVTYFAPRKTGQQGSVPPPAVTNLKKKPH